MAAKKATKKSARKAASSRTAGTGDAVVDGLLAEAAAVGWRAVTLAAVAGRAGIPLGQLLSDAPTRSHLVCRLLDNIDARMLAGVKAIDEKDSPRDRLFEILMRRFDILNQNREGVRAVVTGMARDPAAGLVGICRLKRSMAVMLAAAGISADGPLGLLRIKGLGAVAAMGLRAWLNDDSTDLAKTMAAVDRALGGAERLVGLLKLRRRGQPDEA